MAKDMPFPLLILKSITLRNRWCLKNFCPFIRAIFLSLKTQNPTLKNVVALASYAEEEAAGTSQSQLEVRLLTDLQRRSFEPAWAGPDVTGVLGCAPSPVKR